MDSNSPALAPCRDISIALEDKERNICLGVVLVSESGRCMLSWNIFTHLPEAVGQAQPHNSCADNDDGLCRHPSRRDQVSTIMSKSLLFVLGPAFTDCSGSSSSSSSSSSLQSRPIYAVPDDVLLFHGCLIRRRSRVGPNRIALSMGGSNHVANEFLMYCGVPFLRSAIYGPWRATVH